jgi:hypothetical protein
LRTPRWNRCRRNAPHEPRQHDQVENPHILFGPEPVGANHDPGIEFAPDSLLEGDGFELPVPRQRQHPSLLTCYREVTLDALAVALPRPWAQVLAGDEVRVQRLPERAGRGLSRPFRIAAGEDLGHHLLRALLSAPGSVVIGRETADCITPLPGMFFGLKYPLAGFLNIIRNGW